jgi:predicted transcriptional regulator
MARKKSAHLTEGELRLMEVLWDKGSASVTDVLEALPAKPALAYSTVITILRILEEKGYARHTKDGRAFVYHPVIGREQARETAVAQLVRRFFEGSPELLMLNLVDGGKIGAAELKRLRKRIEEEKS